MVKGQNQRARKQRETERHIQSRRGSRPPTPWDPRTRGETLLPSREKVKEEKGGGGLSPPRFRWHRSAAGAIIITAMYTNNFTAVITNYSPLYAVV